MGLPRCLSAVMTALAVTMTVMAASSDRHNRFQGHAEDRLANYTGLVATAIANSQAPADLRWLAEEQAALRRVATLVARGAQTG